MSGTQQGAGTGPRDPMAVAVILIVVGVAGLAAQVLDLTANVGGLVVAVIGVGFLVAFAFTRHYGYLVPGGIMTGLGAGIVASQGLTMADEQTGGVIVLGLGLGFLSIWVIGAIAHVERHHWWPIIPGGILAVVGAALLIGGQAVNLLDYWGVIIVAIGLLVLWRAWAESRTRA
jgi:hypothetical protein